MPAFRKLEIFKKILSDGNKELESEMDYDRLWNQSVNCAVLDINHSCSQCMHKIDSCSKCKITWDPMCSCHSFNISEFDENSEKESTYVPLVYPVRMYGPAVSIPYHNNDSKEFQKIVKKKVKKCLLNNLSVTVFIFNSVKYKYMQIWITSYVFFMRIFIFLILPKNFSLV